MSVEKPAEKYVVIADQLIPIADFGDWGCPMSSIISLQDADVFESREEANYYKMVKRLDKGVSIDNYRNSKYFQYYKEKLEKDHPEHLL